MARGMRVMGPARAGLPAQVLALALALAPLAGCQVAPAPPLAVPELPEPAHLPAGGAQPAPAEAAEGLPRAWGVATAHRLASEAGRKMIEQGGSAIDAAVAAQCVLALVEPQSSGLGGGAFLLHWDGQRLQAWDGRETAPAAAHERQFLDNAGRPLPLEAATASGLAVGVPGVMRMLEAAHHQHGRLPWARLFEPAITLAERGFPVSPRLAGLLRTSAGQALREDAQAAALFFPGGQALPAGATLRNPALAAVLRRLAQEGATALHEGPVAADIVRRVALPPRPGPLSAGDLAAYRPVERTPLCSPWRRWTVCGFPPPGSGYLATMQILGVLNRLPADPTATAAAGPDTPLAIHRYAEAARLAYADRAQYLGDPAFVPAPAGDWASLLAPGYLDARAALIDDHRSLGPAAPPGQPQRPGEPLPGAATPQAVERGTSHLSIVDAAGRAVALTTTIEAGFGSRRMSDGGTGLAGGFLLNNQLTDFAFVPRDAVGRPVANRVQPGKRPRSSMSPTLVFETAAVAGQAPRLVAVTGSPGGSAIIHFNTRVLQGLLADGLTPAQAVRRPHVANDNGVTRLERGRFPAALADALRQRGQQVVEQDLTSGTQVLWRTDAGWVGAADPRREGVVLGPPSPDAALQRPASAAAASPTSDGPR